MKKSYCFYCQQDVRPWGFSKLRFCPHCKHYITDKGEGFYRVCDYCGANMSVDADCCVKCKRCTDGSYALPLWFKILQNKQISTLLQVVLLILFILTACAVLYLSFYGLIGLMIFGAVFYIFSLFFNK